jgi:hypothetical protein
VTSERFVDIVDSDSYLEAEKEEKNKFSFKPSIKNFTQFDITIKYNFEHVKELV